MVTRRAERPRRALLAGRKPWHCQHTQQADASGEEGRGRTRDCARHDRAILQLDGDGLVVQLHQEPAHTRTGVVTTGQAARSARRERRVWAGCSAHLTSFIARTSSHTSGTGAPPSLICAGGHAWRGVARLKPHTRRTILPGGRSFVCTSSASSSSDSSSSSD